MPRIAWVCSALLSAATLLPVVARAQAARAPGVKGENGAPIAHAVRTTCPPTIDGKLDDPSWQQAPAITEFVQHEPLDGHTPSERTEVRILFDSEAVYVGARMYDREPAGIVRGEAKKDIDLKDMDAFILVLDTYHDRQNGFVFGTTPAGIIYDGQITKEGEGSFGGPSTRPGGITAAPNLNWDGTWFVSTSVDSLGWVAEIKIPFATLQYAGGPGRSWGLNIGRFIRRRNEQIFWAPVPRQFSLYRVSLAGTLDGLEAPSQRSVYFSPYTLGSVSRDYLKATKSDAKLVFGGDAKIGVTPNLTLDLTYNTDFAQVEVDEEQVNLTRFNLFFPEKRLFFLENAGTFAVGTPESVELFFSRRIGINPDGSQVPLAGGGRLTGKVGGLTMGFLDLQTKSAVDTLGARIPHNNYSIGRVFQEFPNRSRLGLILVSRLDTDSSADYNLTYGVDGRLGIGDRVTIEGYWAGTKTPGLNGHSGAYNLSGSYTTRQWELGAALRQVDEAFNPEVGFLERTAFRFYSFRILRHLRTPWLPWFRETRPHITFRQFDDLNGAIQSRLIHVDSHNLFQNGAFFEAPGLNFTREGLTETFEIVRGVKIPPGVYDNFQFVSAFNTNESAPISVSGQLALGGFYTGHLQGYTLTLTTRPSPRVTALLRANYQHVTLKEGKFDEAVLGFRLAYAFTARTYLQSLLQYNNIEDNFSGNVRFGWQGPAGTGFFVVLNDSHRIKRVPGSVLREEQEGPLQRALIIKFTKQFDLTR